MKKFLIAIMATAFLGITSHAQFPTKTQKTITAADTITTSLVGDKVVSVTATYVETSGTSAGKFYIEGSGDGVGWQHIDSSKSLSDVTTAQTITVAVTATIFQSYRVRCSNTSSATGTLYFTILRRPDDRLPAPAPMPMAYSKYIPGNLWKLGKAVKWYVVQGHLRHTFYPV